MTGPAIASATLADIMEVARRGRGLLAPETAGYLVLAIADQLTGSPSVIDERRCSVLVDGGRVVVQASLPSTPLEAERALRRLLENLLQVSSGGAPALHALTSLPAKGEVESLVGELEAALIPVNRAAASRALARVAREALRLRAASGPTGPPPLPASPSAATPAPSRALPPLPGTAPLGPPVKGRDFGPRSGDAVEASSRPVMAAEAPPVPAGLPDFPPEPPTRKKRGALREPLPAASGSDIDDLLRNAIASTPPPALEPMVGLSGRPPATRSSAPSGSRGVDELLADFASSPLREKDLVGWDLRGVSPRADESRAEADLEELAERPHSSSSDVAVPSKVTATAAAVPRAASRPSISSIPPRRSGAKGALAVFLLAGALASAVMLLRRKPGSLSGRTPDVVEAERRAAASAAASAVEKHAALSCRASLVVADVPANAEVLVRSGVSPVDVERVPSGARLEFVATSDGFAPRRGVVPQGASWDMAGGKRRYELAIQLERGRAKPGVLDAWPPAEPGSVVGGDGPPGTVHVVTTPRGAEVWMLAGGSPETTIDALPCGTGLELMVAGSQQGQPFRRRLRVDGSELSPHGSDAVAKFRISASP